MGRVNSYQGCGRDSLTRSGDPGQFFAHFHHARSCAGRIDSTVHFGSDTAGVSLLVGLDEQDFVKHGNAKLKGKGEKLVGDSGGNKVSVRGRSFENQAQTNDCGRLFVFENKFGREWDFEGSWDANEVNPGARDEGRKFVDGRLDHGISVFLVKLRGDDSKLVSSSGRNTWFWRDREAHEMMIYGKRSSPCQTTSGFNQPSALFCQLLSEKWIRKKETEWNRGGNPNEKGEEE